jgi:hypothetical protein
LWSKRRPLRSALTALLLAPLAPLHAADNQLRRERADSLPSLLLRQRFCFVVNKPGDRSFGGF